MTDAEKSRRARGLEKVLQVLEIAHDAILTPEKWDRFADAVAAVSVALDRGDLAAVIEQRMAVERLLTRQKNRSGPGDGPPVKQPPRLRTISDNLSRQVRDALDESQRRNDEGRDGEG
jgi:hypothetical protein